MTSHSETVENRAGTTASRVPPRRWAALASLGWAAIVAAYAFGFLRIASAPRGTVAIDLLFFLVVLALPIALFWLVALLAEELARLRATVNRLAVAMPALGTELAATRAALAEEGPVSADDVARAVRVAMADEARVDVSEPLARLIEGQEEMRDTLRALATDPRRPAPNRPAPKPAARPAAKAAPEPEAVAEPEPEEPRPEWSDLVRALNFPRDADDREGFQALNRAKRHSTVGPTLRGAEDILTLLSEVGIYMDDLDPEPAPVEVWRRYLAGARGPEVAAAGGITDARAMERTRTLLGEDPIFRDTAQHFHRRFDAILADFGGTAGDADLLSLVDTRSGRAFMLLGRARGVLG